MERFALWLLSVSAEEALTGDVLEQYREGRGQGWLWRQVAAVLARRHGPELSYACAGLGLSHAVGFAFSLHLWFFNKVPWWTLPWPWSQLVSDVAPLTLNLLLALPVLGVALRLQGEFAWATLLRTMAWSAALVGAQFYSFALLPEANPYLARSRAFFALLLAAWLGCRRYRSILSRTGLSAAGSIEPR